MAYNITHTDGSTLVSIADGEDDSSTSLTLFGKNHAGYGLPMNENFVRLMENFAATVAPVNPLQGQMWWDKEHELLKVFNGTSWDLTSGTISSQVEPSYKTAGELWWDETNQQLKLWTGTEWALVGVVTSGGVDIDAAETISVLDTLHAVHTITTISIQNTVVAVLSNDASFTVINLPGFSTISPGFNLLSNGLYNGDAANALKLGGTAAANFLRSDVVSTTNHAFNIENDVGINIGSSADINIGIYGNEATVASATNNKDLVFTVTSNNSVQTALIMHGAGTSAGLLTVAANPVDPLGVSTKQYVDTAIASTTTIGNLSSLTVNGPINAASVTSSFIGNISGNLSGNVYGSVNGSVYGPVYGNATTATNLSGTPALPNGTTAVTQPLSNNTTNLATTAFVQSVVSNSVANITSGVSSFNTRLGDVSLTSSDVTTALTFTPVNKAGDTLLGPLVLAADPITALGAATKNYVDSAVSAGGVVSSVAGKTGNVTLVKADVGLSSVDNTTDMDKPVSTATASFVANAIAAVPAGVTAFNSRLGNISLTSLDVTTALTFTPVNKAGDAMTGSLLMGSNSITGLPGVQSSDSSSAASKSYVDGLISGLTWLPSVQLSNLTGTATTPPLAPSTTDAYIIGTGGNTGDWLSFAVGDVVQWQGSSWVFIVAAAIGQHYGINFNNTHTPVGDAVGKQNYIGQITGGTAGNWTWTWTAPAAGRAVFVENTNAYLFGHSYTYVAASSAWTEFSGPTATGAGTGLSYNGNTLNINLGAGVAQLPTDEVGIDIYTGGGLMTTVDGNSSSTATAAQLSLTKVGIAGTYTSLTTDDYGRVTSGSSPTPALATNALQLGGISANSYALLSSPDLTGTPTAPTAVAGTNTTQLATTAFVMSADDLKANIASPTFTGVPAAPTATAGTNTTQLATTAFVANAVGSLVTGVSAFNTRTGNITLSSSDVTSALTYTPVNKAGDTMTGNLILNADPVVSLGAATKGYVDVAISSLTPVTLSISGNTALTASQSGTIIYSTASCVVTLPVTPPAGTRFRIYSNAAGASVAATNLLTFSDGSAVPSYALPANSYSGMDVNFNGASWATETLGQVVISNATVTNQAISLGQGNSLYAPAFTSGTANYFLATPNGSAGVPTLRAIVASDIPTLNQNTTGSAATATTATNLSGGTVAATTGSFSGTLATKIITETKTAPAITAGALTVDLTAGSIFDISLNANITTLTLSNPPASGTPIGFTMVFTADGTARTIAWPASVKWPGGTAPTMTSTAGKKDVLSFITFDAGTTYLSFIAGQNI